MTSRSVASWLFGGLLLVFYVSYLAFAPAVLPDFKVKMLGILSGILTGLFVYFFTGEITAKIKTDISPGHQLAIQATGGIALALLTVIYWAYGPTGVTPTSDATDQLLNLLQGGKGVQVQADPSNRSLFVQTTPQVRSLARAIADSDPAYRSLAPLQAEHVSAKNFSTATAALRPLTPTAANLAILQGQFGNGIGPFHFGMSPEQVNANFPEKFATVSWDTLPRASEYKSADVRYLWTPLAQFPKSGLHSTLYQSLVAFHECWGGGSYITFQFVNQALAHISVRLLADCSTHQALLRTFATQAGIRVFNSTGPLAFEVSFNGVTVIGYTGSDVSSLDAFLSNSPQT